MKSFKLFLLASAVILFSSTLYGSDPDCTPNNRVEQGSGDIIDGDCVDSPDLPYDDRPDCGDDQKLVQGNDNNCTDGTLAADPGPYPPVPSTPCPAGKIVDQGTGECTIDAPDTSEPLPANLTIDYTALQKWIVSTYDDTPYDPAIDIQGVVGPNGLTISVPYTVVTAPVTLPTRKSSVTLDASVTQDGESGIIATFAWAEQVLPVGSGTFTAMITISTDIYNAKQLDVDDTEGLVAATFPYATDNTGSEGNLTLKIITVIPDRMFGVADNTGSTTSHEFLYIPVTNPKTGKTWLSNNLGANYANMNSSEYNITKQATASNDHNAYGSLFQWGRKADGHELINWTSGSSGSSVHGTTFSLNNNPNHALFIKAQVSPVDWRINQDGALWTSESSINNVCPAGYRVPTVTELEQEKVSWGSSNGTGAIGSPLKLPLSGIRRYYSGDVANGGGYGNYWSSTPYSSGSFNYWINSGNAGYQNTARATGNSVRCIKD